MHRLKEYSTSGSQGRNTSQCTQRCGCREHLHLRTGRDTFPIPSWVTQRDISSVQGRKQSSDAGQDSVNQPVAIA